MKKKTKLIKLGRRTGRCKFRIDINGAGMAMFECMTHGTKKNSLTGLCRLKNICYKVLVKKLERKLLK